MNRPSGILSVVNKYKQEEKVKMPEVIIPEVTLYPEIGPDELRLLSAERPVRNAMNLQQLAEIVDLPLDEFCRRLLPVNPDN